MSGRSSHCIRTSSDVNGGVVERAGDYSLSICASIYDGASGIWIP